MPPGRLEARRDEEHLHGVVAACDVHHHPFVSAVKRRQADRSGGNGLRVLLPTLVPIVGAAAGTSRVPFLVSRYAPLAAATLGTYWNSRTKVGHALSW